MSSIEPVQTEEIGEYEYTAVPSKRMEVAIAVVALAFCVTLLVVAQNLQLRFELPAGQMNAKVWPSALAILGIILATGRLLIVLTNRYEDRDDLEIASKDGLRQLVTVLGLTALYVFVWGFREDFSRIINFPLFMIVTPLFLAALVYIFGGRNWKALILYPVFIAAFSYGLFGMLLRIPL